jgi:hypothetical protein
MGEHPSARCDDPVKRGASHFRYSALRERQGSVRRGSCAPSPGTYPTSSVAHAGGPRPDLPKSRCSS